MADVNLSSTDNRKGPDLIFRIVDRASLILWAIIIVNTFIVLSAKPQGETFFDRLLHIRVPNVWDFRLLRLSMMVSIGQFIVSLFYLYLNSRRLKRKNDKIRVSIIISIFFSLILSVLLALIIYL